MKNVIIITGSKRSGKSTAVENWIKRKAGGVVGILSPEINGKRYFKSISTGEEWAMEASGNEESLNIGKYNFSKSAFDKASKILLDAAKDKTAELLVIDEVGPLELKNEGFYNTLQSILEMEEGIGSILLVVREGLVNDIRKHFGIGEENSKVMLITELLTEA
jgi:nucleoside-triphosphatase THEP1